ncbi:ABC transporter substrate-binding protein [Streptomyces sp. NPDC057486]|uniref:ABC transporter substrate-binding protein n=1 Tax=Streptomyces sp. NPDC057486 TaxID=3346145 RepID=UPI0036CFDB0E
MTASPVPGRPGQGLRGHDPSGAAPSGPGEFTADHLGRTVVLRGAVPPERLVLYARGFLLLNRPEVQFVYRADGLWLDVRMERHRARGDQQDHALVSTGEVRSARGLTRREIDVLTLVAVGLTNTEAAERLGTRPRTVSTQVERLLQKLGQRSRAGLAALAVDSNLLALPMPGGVEDVAQVAVVGVERFATMFRTDPERMWAPAPASARKPILLGSLVSLSGSAAEDGEEHLRGTALAVEEINAAGGIGGRRVEHVVEDCDIDDPDAVRTAMNQLVAAEVDAVTSNYLSAENPFLLEMAADYGRPFLHLDTFERHAELVRSEPLRYWMVFQTCPSEKYYASAFVRFVRGLEHHRPYSPRSRTVAVVEMDSPSARIADSGLGESLASVGWSVALRSTVPVRRVDWGRVVEQITGASPDLVLVAHFVPDEIAVLHRLLHESGFPGLVHYVYAASLPRFRNLLGSMADGAVWSSTTSRTDSVTATRFQRNYLLRYGVEPGPTQASAAFDQVQLLAWAWARNGGTVPAGTCRALREDVHRGLNGIYSFADGGQSPLSFPDGTSDPTLGQPLITSQIQNGRSVVLSPPDFGSISRLHLPSG